MRRGADPTAACREALRMLVDRKLALGEDCGSMSLIALVPDGTYGAATTLPVFPFAAGRDGMTGLFTAGSDSEVIRGVTGEEIADEP